MSKKIALGPPMGFGFAVGGLALTQYVTPMSVQYLDKVFWGREPVKLSPSMGFGFAITGLNLTRYVTPMEPQHFD